MATLSTPSGAAGPDPHDPKDAALLQKMGSDPEVRAAWKRAFDLIAPYRYAYNWTWLGRPAIQFPQDMVALQEIIWRTAMVVLDSNHTAEHVARELARYAPRVRAGFFLVVMDTVVEYQDAATIVDRPWGPGNNPMTAVDAFLAREPRFEIDEEYDAKLLFTVAPRGYLRALRDPK